MIPYFQTAIEALRMRENQLKKNADSHDKYHDLDRNGNYNPSFIGASKKRQEVRKAIRFMELLNDKLERKSA